MSDEFFCKWCCKYRPNTELWAVVRERPKCKSCVANAKKAVAKSPKARAANYKQAQAAYAAGKAWVPE